MGKYGQQWPGASYAFAYDGLVTMSIVLHRHGRLEHIFVYAYHSLVFYVFHFLSKAEGGDWMNWLRPRVEVWETLFQHYFWFAHFDITSCGLQSGKDVLKCDVEKNLTMRMLCGLFELPWFVTNSTKIFQQRCRQIYGEHKKTLCCLLHQSRVFISS